VIERALKGGLGPTEVITSFLDSANFLTQGCIRDSWVNVYQLVFFWITGSYSEVPATLRKICVGVKGR